MESQRYDNTAHQVPARPPLEEAPLILLVDDVEDALDIYGQYLTYRGYRVVVARNGLEAVKKARICRPDLVLLDLRMPIMTGLDTLRIMRADESLARVPIVALTAHALDEERQEALNAGFDDFIAKPCLPDELVRALQRHLPAWSASPASSEPDCAEVKLGEPSSQPSYPV